MHASVELLQHSSRQVDARVREVRGAAVDDRRCRRSQPRAGCLDERDRLAGAAAAGCSRFTAGSTRVVPNPPLGGLLPRRGQGVRAGCGARRTTPRRCCCGWLAWDGRDPEVTAPKPRPHPAIRTHRAQHVERTFAQGHPGHSAGPHARSTSPRCCRTSGSGERSTRRSTSAASSPSICVTSRHRGAQEAASDPRAPPRRRATSTRTSSSRSCCRAGLPMPEVNQSRLRYFPDFRWPGAAGDPRGRQQAVPRPDARSRRRLRAASASSRAHGETVIRTTWVEAVTKPGAVVRASAGARRTRASISRVQREKVDARCSVAVADRGRERVELGEVRRRRA